MYCRTIVPVRLGSVAMTGPAAQRTPGTSGRVYSTWNRVLHHTAADPMIATGAGVAAVSRQLGQAQFNATHTVEFQQHSASAVIGRRPSCGMRLVAISRLRPADATCHNRKRKVVARGGIEPPRHGSPGPSNRDSSESDKTQNANCPRPGTCPRPVHFGPNRSHPVAVRLTSYVGQ